MNYFKIIWKHNLNLIWQVTESRFLHCIINIIATKQCSEFIDFRIIRYFYSKFKLFSLRYSIQKFDKFLLIKNHFKFKIIKTKCSLRKSQNTWHFSENYNLNDFLKSKIYKSFLMSFKKLILLLYDF